MFSRFDTIHAHADRRTDGQTDRQMKLAKHTALSIVPRSKKYNPVFAPILHGAWGL